ncbi:MAG: dihydrodipicolinate synthase family protein [Clostridiales bacterium]|nr:dihydrodipicolinate synthase family protein [Clostridiales bacterium]
MTTQQDLRGVIVASITPMDRAGKLDTGAIRRLMAYYANSGLRGAFFPSSSGEYFALTAEQRGACVREAARHKAEGFALLANISEGSLAAVWQNARQMADAGADALVLMPPQFHHHTQDELIRFFTEAADASPLPLILYNHMTRLPSRLDISTVLRLKEHPRIVGLKDTHNDAARLMALSTQLDPGEDFLVFTGGDGMAGFGSLYGMEMLNALCAIRPDLFLQIYEKGRAGDIGEVSRLQQRVNRLAGIFTCLRGGAGSAVLFSQSIKGALHLKGLCDTCAVQLGSALDDVELKQIERILNTVDE